MLYKMILSTFPNRASAKTVAMFLVENKMAACCQLSDVESIYNWKGKTEREFEIRLSVKTSAALVGKVVAKILSSHTYEIPQIVITDFETTEKFGSWIDSSVKA